MGWLILIVFACVLIGFYDNHQKKLKRKLRIEGLLEKYGDLEVVENIMQQMFWQGQTEEQLIDSLGKPLDIDQKVLKTKKKETWKYDQVAKNRYALKVILENGLVVGWDKK